MTLVLLLFNLRFNSEIDQHLKRQTNYSLLIFWFVFAATSTTAQPSWDKPGCDIIRLVCLSCWSYSHYWTAGLQWAQWWLVRGGSFCMPWEYPNDYSWTKRHNFLPSVTTIPLADCSEMESTCGTGARSLQFAFTQDPLLHITLLTSLRCNITDMWLECCWLNILMLMQQSLLVTESNGVLEHWLRSLKKQSKKYIEIMKWPLQLIMLTTDL